MKLDSKKQSKSKRIIKAHEISIAETLKFFSLYYGYKNACKDLGITQAWGWMLKNGFCCVPAETALKMYELSEGTISYDALMTRNEKINKKSKKVLTLR